jgi:hypothetical protein
VIRYVDSCGWTWAVCELADRPGPDSADADADAPPGRRARAAPPPDRPLALAPHRAAGGPADLPAGDAGEPPGELYFFSRLGTRKLRGYPAAWAVLPRAGLEALCERAQVIGDAGAAVLA